MCVMCDLGFLQVGSYFVGQYYQVLQKQPDVVHQFYSEGSSIIHVDGDSTDSASSIVVIVAVCILWPEIEFLGSVLFIQFDQ